MPILAYIGLGCLALYVLGKTALWWFEANWLHGNPNLRGFKNWLKFMTGRYYRPEKKR